MASKLKTVSARKGTKSPKVQPALANTTAHGSCKIVLHWSVMTPRLEIVTEQIQDNDSSVVHHQDVTSCAARVEYNCKASTQSSCTHNKVCALSHHDERVQEISRHSRCDGEQDSAPRAVAVLHMQAEGSVKQRGGKQVRKGVLDYQRGQPAPPVARLAHQWRVPAQISPALNSEPTLRHSFAMPKTCATSSYTLAVFKLEQPCPMCI